jgi:predicted anti-sigma-YlaC factor YlaD
VECQQCRDAVSARIDGEDPGTPDDLVDHHLTRCPSCRAWAGDLGRLGRALRVAPVEPIPDLTAPILAAAAAERRRTAAGTGPARVALALVGVAQLIVALPGLLGDESGASIHVAREYGSWEVALAAGLLVAAFQPARTTGLLPLVAVLTATLLGATAIDIITGHTTVTAESAHLLPVTGLTMLVLVRRWSPAPSAPLRAA